MHLLGGPEYGEEEEEEEERIMGKRWIRVKVGGQNGRRMWKGLLSAVWVGGWVSRICGGKEGGRAIVDGIKAFGGELVDGRRRRSRRGGLSGWEYRREYREYREYRRV